MTLRPSDIEAITAALQPQFDHLGARLASQSTVLQTINLRLKTAELRLNALDRSLEVHHERFKNFVDYFEGEAERAGTVVSQVRAGVECITDKLDVYAKQMETSEQERLVQGKQLDALELRVRALESAALRRLPNSNSPGGSHPSASTHVLATEGSRVLGRTTP